MASFKEQYHKFRLSGAYTGWTNSDKVPLGAVVPGEDKTGRGFDVKLHDDGNKWNFYWTDCRATTYENPHINQLRECLIKYLANVAYVDKPGNTLIGVHNLDKIEVWVDKETGVLSNVIDHGLIPETPPAPKVVIPVEVYMKELKDFGTF